MHQPKTLQILNSFDSADWRACTDFLTGRLRPGHDCMLLFLDLKSQRASLKSSSLNIEDIKFRLFPKITDKSFTNLLSKLALKLEEYLVFQCTLQEKTDFDLLLLKAYAQRGLYSEFDKKARKVEKGIMDEEHIQLFDQMNLLRLNHLRYFSDNPIKNKMGRSLLSQLSKSNDMFKTQYGMLLNTAKFHLNEVSKPGKKEIDDQTMPQFLSEVLSLLEQFKKDSTQESFDRLYNILMSENTRLSVELSTIILELLIHYAHKQIRKGQMSVIESLLDLYELGFRSGMLLTNNRITETRFINVVGTACAGENYTRADHIIEDYGHLLIDNTRAGTIQISKAHLYFYQENFDELVETIRDYPFNSIGQNTRRRWMLLCAYYSLHSEDWEFTYNQVKNYNNYFYNNKSKMSKAMFEGSMNLSKMITKMLRGRSKDEVVNFIGSCNHFIYRKWALKEVETFEVSTP